MILRENILEVKNLCVSVNQKTTSKIIIDNLNFQIKRGEILGMAGASGSGKSTTALAIMQLIKDKSHFAQTGHLTFGDKQERLDLLPENKLCEIRGNSISLICQDASSALNPIKRCGDQLIENIKLHQKNISKQTQLDLAFQWMQKVKLDDSERIFKAYPHEISGGQAQRLIIAMALVNSPELIIADEATSGLDVRLQNEIVILLKSLVMEAGTSLLFISHDLTLIRNIADRVIILNNGKIVEEGDTDSVFSNPKMDYTKQLMNARSGLSDSPFNFNKSEVNKISLEVDNVSVRYPKTKSWLGIPTDWVFALNDLSLQLSLGQTIGIVGESGSGKSTFAKSLVDLIEPFKGTITYLKNKILSSNEKNSRLDIARKRQIIFQDPYSALNPRMTILDAVAEPLLVHHIFKGKAEAKSEAVRLLALTGLDERVFYSYPDQLSGGERQRVCIARAIALKPSVLVLDEAVSSLDSIHCMMILDLLKDLQKDLNLSYIFISHDLEVVSFMSDYIIVLKDGYVVESGYKSDILKSPKSEYTRELIALSGI
ncbi:MAG: ABC transporter ATP-binding protein [Saprospiraceae bacterium]|nr:ABC transporter ATP-binding protein [Saprospiraceae bacterium]